MDRRIESADIRPEDFRNTTIPVEPIGKPEDAFVAVVRIPRMLVGEAGEAVTMLGRGPGGLKGSSSIRWPLVIPYETFVSGGEANGLKFQGILEEANIRYRLGDLRK